MISLLSYHISYASLSILFGVAALIGMSKTGVQGTGMLAVPLLAIVFGGQASSGALLPVMIIADVFAVIYYHRHAEWHYLRKLFPWTFIGIILGTITGNYIDDDTFRSIMAIIIFLSLAVMLWLERSKSEEIPDYFWFAAVVGTVGGFTSMVGNLAGTVMAVYFLSMRLPKNVFIGTGAWFFMVINWLKVPFHVFVWHTISADTFLMGLLTLPAILLGAFLGIIITKRISEKSYRWFIISITACAAIFMLI